MDTLPTAIVGCKLGTATHGVKKIVFVMSARKEVDECKGKGGVKIWVNASLLSNNSS